MDDPYTLGIVTTPVTFLTLLHFGRKKITMKKFLSITPKFWALTAKPQPEKRGGRTCMVVGC